MKVILQTRSGHLVAEFSPRQNPGCLTVAIANPPLEIVSWGTRLFVFHSDEIADDAPTVRTYREGSMGAIV